MNNETQKGYWTRLSDWLKGMNVIPLILCVSGYHYYRALSVLDEPFLSAAAIAVIVDVTHYGSVERFRDSKGGWGSVWWFIAMAVCTAIGISLKYSFYNGDTDVFSAVALRNAVIVPAMVVIFGFLEGNEAEQEQEQEAQPTADVEAASLALTAELIRELKPKQANMLQVLDMVGQGMSHADMAEALQVTPATIGRYVKELNGAIANHEQSN